MPSFRHRLTRTQQKVYDRSDALSSVPAPVSLRLSRAVELLQPALAHDDRARIERVSQVICDELCTALRVVRLKVRVKRVRPPYQGGELHGLYESAGRKQEISVWMYTAKRRQVVAYKTFLRTLLHELCHHLDYTFLKLDESFHTDGFFKRESSLVHQVLEAVAAVPGGGREAAPPHGSPQLRGLPARGGQEGVS